MELSLQTGRGKQSQLHRKHHASDLPSPYASAGRPQNLAIQHLQTTTTLRSQPPAGRGGPTQHPPCPGPSGPGPPLPRSAEPQRPFTLKLRCLRPPQLFKFKPSSLKYPLNHRLSPLALLPPLAPADWLLFNRPAGRLALHTLRSLRGRAWPPRASGAHAQRQPAAYPARASPARAEGGVCATCVFYVPSLRRWFLPYSNCVDRRRSHTLLLQVSACSGLPLRKSRTPRPPTCGNATTTVPSSQPPRPRSLPPPPLGEGRQVRPASREAPAASLSFSSTHYPPARAEGEAVLPPRVEPSASGAGGHCVQPVR